MTTASTQLRALEGEIATMFARIMAAAIAGLADAAIVEHKTYTAEDSLAAVQQLAELARSLRAENQTFRNAQKACEDCDGPTLAEMKSLRTENATLKRRLDEAMKEREKDAARLDWLEAWAKKSPTGISFDHVKACEGDPSGFRFMRRFHIGQPHKTIRAAIDAEMDHNPHHRD